jgi:hypothetical protein
MHHDYRRGDRDHADRDQLGIGIWQIFQKDAVGDHPGRADQERIPVGRRLGDDRGADDRAGSRAVFNYNGLPQALADGLAREPRDQIVCAAGAEWNDPTDGVLRPFGARAASAARAHGEAGRKKQGPARGCTSAGLVF